MFIVINLPIHKIRRIDNKYLKRVFEEVPLYQLGLSVFKATDPANQISTTIMLC